MRNYMEFFDNLVIDNIGNDVFTIEANGEKFLFDNITASIARLNSSLCLNDNSQMKQIYSKLDPYRKKKRIFNPREYLEHRHLSRMMLFLTSTCNMRCIYCHCNSSDGMSMSDNTIKIALKKYIMHIENRLSAIKEYNDVPQITFMGGGEPFIKIDKIKEIVDFF